MTVTRDQAVELACGIQGWMNRDELGWLYDRAGEVPPGGTWVEVGTWKGRSAMATGLGLSQGSKLVCVDTFQGNPESSCHWESQLDGWLEKCSVLVLDTIQQMRPDVCTRLLNRPSSEVAGGVDGCPHSLNGISSVFIDASHEYAALCSDIRAWLPRLKPGGLLCGHDLCSEWYEVETAVVEVLGSFQMAIRNCLLDEYASRIIKETNAGTIWWWRKPL